MTFKNQDILYELQELAPLLAQLDRTNPFSVPKKYFQNTQQPFDDDLTNATDSVFQKIDQSGKNIAFAVPQYYFDDMHDQLLLTIVADTLADEPISPMLQQLGRKSGMVAPQGYFDELYESVMLQILDEKNETTLNLGITKSFKVPEGYFDSFASNLLDKIQTIEAETEPSTPTLDTIGKKTGFVTPINYFEQAVNQIEQQTKRAAAKVIPMQPQRVAQSSTTDNIRTIVRYSLSAAAMLAMFVVGMQFLNQPNNNNLAQIENNDATLLAFNDQTLVNMSQGDLMDLMDKNISAEDAKAYIAENIDDFADELEDDAVIAKIDMSEASLADFDIDPKAAAEMLKELD